MRKALIIILLLLSAFPTFAEIEMLDTIHDFGLIDEVAGAVKARFRFVNRTDAPISISNIRTTCGCTTSDFPTKAIAIGDTAFVEISYNPSGHAGEFSKKATINFLPGNIKLAVKVKGNVIGSDETINWLYPDSIGSIHFEHLALVYGDIPKGHSRTMFADGYNRSRDSVAVEAINISPALSVVCEPAIVAPGGMVHISVNFNTLNSLQWGTVKEDFTLVATSLKTAKTSQGTMSACAVIVDDITEYSGKGGFADAPIAETSTSKLSFGIMKRGTGGNIRTLTITNRGKSPLEIRQVASFSNQIATSVDKYHITTNDMATITVAVDADGIPDAVLNETIKIFTNAPANQTIEIRCVGEIK